MSKPTDLVQGTLDLLLLKILALGPLHGWAISLRLGTISGDVLQVSEGSLYPALHKLEQEGWIEAEWKQTENNRRAKFYSLTRLGRKELESETANWERLSGAISRVVKLKERAGGCGACCPLCGFDSERFPPRSRKNSTKIRDHIDRRVAADVARGVPREQALGCAACLWRHRRIEGSVPGRPTREIYHHTIQDLRARPSLRPRAISHGDDDGIFALGIGFSTALFLFVRSFVNGPVPGIPRRSLVRIRGIDRAYSPVVRSARILISVSEHLAQTALFSDVAPVVRCRLRRQHGEETRAPHLCDRQLFQCWAFARHSALASTDAATPRRRSSP